MRTLERPPARPVTHPVVRVPGIELQRAGAPSPSRRRTWLVVIAVVAALALIGGAVYVYVDQASQIDDLERTVAGQEAEIYARAVYGSAQRAEMAALGSEVDLLSGRVDRLRSDLKKAQLGAAATSQDLVATQQELAETEAALAAARAQEQELQAYLDSLILCSAAGMPGLRGQAGLPAAVATMRTEIGRTALTCDLVGLRQLAMAGGPFWYAWDTDLRPASYWAVEEVRGNEPTRSMVGMLALPYGTERVDGHTIYVWPKAATYDTWADVPSDDRAALRGLYDEDDFAAFRAAGAYIGYRLQIRESGNWTVFVSGD